LWGSAGAGRVVRHLGFKKSQKRRTFVKRIRIFSVLLALAVLAALAIVTTTLRHTVRAVYASNGCTDATLTGNYAFNFTGFTTPVFPNVEGQEVPIAAVGVFTFDGAGNFSTSFTSALNGDISTGNTASGTYTVNSNCTGSIAWTTGPFAGVTFNMAVIGGGPEIFGIDTDKTAGITATFDAKKQ
jgi:ABC-type Fe3+-siderophore transport system permease subunit